MLNQGECAAACRSRSRSIQIYAATAGFLDRITSTACPSSCRPDRTDARPAPRACARRSPAGDWSDETQQACTPPWRRSRRTSATTSTRRASRSRRPPRPSGGARDHDGKPARRTQQDPSVKNIQKITRALEAVAAARLRRAEQRIKALRPYAEAIGRMTRQAARAAGAEASRLPLLTEHETQGNVGLLVITGDAGLPAASTRR